MFIITKAQVYKKYITIKVLYQIIVFCLILNFVLIAFYIIERILQPNFYVVPYILLSAEIYFNFITIVVYVYLFYFAQSKSQKITNKRHCGINFNKKLMMTITYTYICLLLFTIPHFVGIVISFFSKTQDKRMLKNLHYWINTLVYSNSYVNAFIILYHNNERKYKKNKA